MTLELETDRLTLRQWRLEDFEALAALLADAEANRYRGPGRALTRDESWAHLCEVIGQWPLRGYGQLALEEAATSRVIGWAGLWHPIVLDEPELAWSLFPAAQGRGFATEAAMRVMRWAADDLDLPPLFSFVHPDNAPSRKLAERLGATLEGDTIFRGQPRLIYRHRDLHTSNINPSNQRKNSHVSRKTAPRPWRCQETPVLLHRCGFEHGATRRSLHRAHRLL